MFRFAPGRLRGPGVCLYFAVMEALQFLQYFWVDQCGHPMNAALTYLAFIHISLQPLAVNWYFFGGEAAGDGPYACSARLLHLSGRPAHVGAARQAMARFILRLSLLAAVLLLLRLPLLPGGLLGARASAAIPDFPASSTAGVSCGPLDVLTGANTCTFSGPRHLAWRVRLLPSSYFLPGGFVHFFLFYCPVLLAADPPSKALMALVLLTGVLPSMALASGSIGSYAHEWPAIWCFMSVLQCSLVLARELLLLPALARRQARALGTTGIRGDGAPCEAVGGGKARRLQEPLVG